MNNPGFSDPYCYAIIVSGVFWAFAGIYLLKKLLLRYFSPAVSRITVLAIMLGTNFYNYATLEAGMSHGYSFFLFAAAVLVADNYYKRSSKGQAMLLGLLFGWIVLLRPTNIVMIPFLLLWNVATVDGFKARCRFLRQHFSQLLWAIPFSLAILVPQLCYWKEMTGQWIKYSYEGEGFIYWNHPKIAAVLFDTENGLFLYSPILLFFLYALLFRRKDSRTNFWGMVVVFPVITYLFASWWAWWFGGAFGHRCYVEYFALFALPLAVTVEAIASIRLAAVRLFIAAIMVFFCYYNIVLSCMYMYLPVGVWDGPDWRWNWRAWWQLVSQIFNLKELFFTH